tara:strand:+ start:52 stop:477 length:426 start_codon:yes stop_codon:yes gene_type:complete
MIVGDKLMVFHASGVDASTVTSADNGADIDLCALPMSAITSVFAEEDMVYVYFKEAGRFELGLGSADGTDDQVKTMEQTFVRLTVAEGKEADVVKDFAALCTANQVHSGNPVVFDAVNSTWPINNVTAIQIRRHLAGHVLA